MEKNARKNYYKITREGRFKKQNCKKTNQNAQREKTKKILTRMTTMS